MPFGLFGWKVAVIVIYILTGFIGHTPIEHSCTPFIDTFRQIPERRFEELIKMVKLAVE